MKTKTILAILAVVIPLIAAAQQTSSTPQPTPAQAPPAAMSTIPCTKSIPAQQRNPSYVEKKFKTLACKQNPQFCDLPSSPAEVTGVTPDAKPCPPPAAISAAPKPQTQPAPIPPAAQASATGSNKTTFACPPQTSLIPGFPYCLKPDHTTVDAIPLPASSSAPAPLAPTAPAPAQH
jgi:hypothetical protein